MESNTAYSNNTGSASGIGYFQTCLPRIPKHLTDNLCRANQVLTPSIPKHLTDNLCRANQVLTQQHLDRHQNRCLKNLSQFFTNLDNVSDDVRKITAMSPAEVRTFLSHGDSWVDGQMLNALFEAMQGLENQLFHLRVLNIPFALAAPETSGADQGVTFQLESSDEETFKLPIALSPSRPPTPDDSPARALDLKPDNTPKASPIREAVPVDRASRQTCQATRKRGAINRELQMPESLNEILDDIISSGTRQRQQSGYQEDLISCYSRLNDCATGKDIVELLHAVLLSGSEAEACTDLFKLQQRIAGNESPITVYQLRDLKIYLSSQVFNGKKVNFTLMDMYHYLKLSTKQEFLDYAPPALAQLVRYLIETTLNLRDTEKVALNKRSFLKELRQSNDGRLAIKLLNAIALTPPDYKVVREVLIEATDTDNINAVRKVSNATINLLKKELTDHFFTPWLLDFKSSELNSVTEEAVPRKLRRGARGERLPTSTFRYEFDPTYPAPGMG